MQKILSLIDNVGLSLSRYLDEKSKSKDGENKSSALSSGVNKGNMLNACATLRGKYEMLCHSIGICALSDVAVGNIEVSNIDILINESESHRIKLSRDPLDRANIVCNFYNMVNISASFRDAIAKLVLYAYSDEIKTKVGDDKFNWGNLTSIQLSKTLGENCLLGAVMANYVSHSEEYKKIITLRDYLVHHSVTGVLSVDYIHPNSAPKVDSAWTPTGAAMSLPDYAKFVYITSADLVTRICKCIAEKPAECIEV